MSEGFWAVGVIRGNKYMLFFKEKLSKQLRLIDLLAFLIICLSLIILNGYSTKANSAECENTLQQIVQDIQKYGTSVNTQNLNWKDPNWLDKQLGPSQKIENPSTLYQWEKFALLMRSDGTFISSGDIPENIKAKMSRPTIEDFKTELGEPKQTILKKITAYQWNCGNFGSTLTLIFNDNNEPISAQGLYCMEINNCISFGGFLGGKDLLNVKFNEIVLKNAVPLEEEIMDEKIKAYNDQFKTNFKNMLEVNQDMESRLKAYYANLRQCKPGSYEYGIFSKTNKRLVISSTTILGLKASKCETETYYGKPTPKMLSKCHYTSEGLSIFNDDTAKGLVSGTIIYDPSKPSEMQKLKQNECEIWIRANY